MNSLCQAVQASGQLALFVQDETPARVETRSRRLRRPIDIDVMALPPRLPLPMLPLNQHEWTEELIETVRGGILECLDWPCEEGITTDQEDDFDFMQLDLYPGDWGEWTEDAIQTLRARLLKRLKGLKDRRTFKEEKRACTRWITERLHARRGLPKSPFSFQVCCYATGADPEEVRDQLLWTYAPAMLPFVRAVDDWRLRNVAQRIACNSSNSRLHSRMSR